MTSPVAVAETLLAPGAQRDRLTADIYRGEDRADHPIAKLELAFDLKTACGPIERRMRDAKMADVAVAKAAGVIDDRDAALLARAEEAIAEVIAVDAFAAEELSGAGAKDRHARPPLSVAAE